MCQHLGGLPRQTVAGSKGVPRRADVLETGDFGGDKLGGLEFAGFASQKAVFAALQTPGAGFPRKTSEFGDPGTTFDAGHEKRTVFSAFCTKNGVVTSSGDIGKTFSGLTNLAVLQGFGNQIRKLIGWYKPSFLTTPLFHLVQPGLEALAHLQGAPPHAGAPGGAVLPVRPDRLQCR